MSSTTLLSAAAGDTNPTYGVPVDLTSKTVLFPFERLADLSVRIEQLETKNKSLQQQMESFERNLLKLVAVIKNSADERSRVYIEIEKKFQSVN
jgi:replication-associated recombination protein RarA